MGGMTAHPASVPGSLPYGGAGVRPPGLPLALATIVLSLVGGFVARSAAPALFPAWTVPPMILAALALAALELLTSRRAAAGAPWAFWTGIALSALAVLASPFFGLHAWLAYLRISADLRRAGESWAGVVAAALICSYAQTGGVFASFFTPGVWAAFLAINLVIAAMAHRAERRRQTLVEQLRRANEDLRRSEARSAALHEQLVERARTTGMLEERRRLARELHDTITQDLVAVIALISVAAEAEDPAERTRRFSRAEETARGALAESRRAVDALSSPRLDSADLPQTLERLLDAVRETYDLRADLRIAGEARATLADPAALRIIQEALSNAARHADATGVDVRLDYREGELGIEVRDDGTGFDPDAPRTGHGLDGMRERAAVAGGRLEVDSRVGTGTSIRATLPLRRTP